MNAGRHAPRLQPVGGGQRRRQRRRPPRRAAILLPLACCLALCSLRPAGEATPASAMAGAPVLLAAAAADTIQPVPPAPLPTAADTARATARLREPEPPALAGRAYTVTTVLYRDAVRERDIFTAAIPELLAYVASVVALPVPVRWNSLALDNPKIADALLLYMTGQDAALRVTPAERLALGRYLKEGGMLFAEDVVSGGTPDAPPLGGGLPGTPFDRQLRALIGDPAVLGARGTRWQRVPRDHPLYGNWFSFPDGPPLAGAYQGSATALEMIEYRGRIAVLFSDLNLSWFWATREARARERPLQLGANIVAQALLQRYAGMRPPPAPAER